MIERKGRKEEEMIENKERQGELENRDQEYND